MDVKFGLKNKMEKYNIYAGLGGSFGGAQYLYTSLFNSKQEADDEAYIAACEEYESYEGIHGIKDWEDCFIKFCEEKGIDDTPENQEKYIDIVNELYQDEKENWIEYYSVLTKEDDILERDLILDYIEEDDSTSKTSSKS